MLPLGSLKDSELLSVVSYPEPTGYKSLLKDVLMVSLDFIPLLLLILIGLVLGWLGQGVVRSRNQEVGNLMGTRDDMLLGLLVLAFFALGVFVAYVLLIRG
jgi:p-aminobenzoyl-glutamate transporter AbgT